MATAIGCDLCETEPAVMMQTSLVNGETISVGEACLLVFMAGALKGMLTSIDASVLEMHQPEISLIAADIYLAADPAAVRDKAPEPAAQAADDAAIAINERMADIEMAAGFTQAYDDPESVQG